MTVTAKRIGDSIDLLFTFRARDNTLTNPSTIALTIREPDGTEIAKTQSDMTNLSTGLWRYIFAITKEGTHVARADGDGVVEAAAAVVFRALRKGTS